MKPFTQSLESNIKQTFTYSHAKNKYNYEGRAEGYDSLSFFKKNVSAKKSFSNTDGFGSSSF
ncbi:hypothetical protein [Carnobacterium viridans]|uniref:Uncharacterized protein n=1 Tax=Carnobacterium viridans TaxID=174587 RepID=A0A1H1BTY8_9LACT|nr:hypothetical protein [Carnobacterium viridans]SDQ55393.1 hypothetical protein SAMN04487752_2743 [Carnobacterium viridans]